MVIGVLREIKDGENRVAMTPAGVKVLSEHGHQMLVESRAGAQSGIRDEEYAQQGAELRATAAEVWSQADMIVKVKEPLPQEYELLRQGQILFTYLHLAASRELTEALLASGVSAVGYETMQAPDGSLPLLKPMSEVAGRLAPQIGADALQANHGGRGVLLSGVPGVAPAEVVVIGCGTAGFNAAKLARGMGAHVTVLDINHDRLKYVDDVMQGTLTTVYSSPLSIAHHAAYADLLICAVLIPGAKAPELVTGDTVRSMRPATVILDIAIDQGGSVEGIRPTSHSQPTYVEDGVIHYAVPNIPALVPRTSTFALTNATISYVLTLAELGVEKACEEDTAIASGLNTHGGKLVHPAVQAAFPDLPAS